MKRINGLLAIDGNGHDAHTFELDYLNEGAANIVFKIENVEKYNGTIRNLLPALILESNSVSDGLRNRVLRLRKDDVEASTVRQNWREFTIILQALGLSVHHEQILAPTLVHVGDDLREKCNSILLKDASTKEAVGVSMSEDSAMILKDMSSDEFYASHELKLKWLAPSPSAPADAKCCRSCALNAMKMTTGSRKAPKVRSCPLGHLTGGSLFRETLMSELKLDPSTDTNKCQQWLELLGSTEAVRKLHKAQMDLDPEGPASDDQYLSSLNFRIAMTLRDCSIIARIPKVTGPAEKVEWALVDLDLKPDSQVKRDHWRGTEHKLTTGGYYTLSREDQAALGLRCYLKEFTMFEGSGFCE